MKNLNLAPGGFGGGGNRGGGGGGGRFGGKGKGATGNVFNPGDEGWVKVIRGKGKGAMESVFNPGAVGGGKVVGGGRVSRGTPHVPVYATILEILAERFEKDLAKNRPHLIGLIFGKPYVDLVEKQIRPDLENLHHRSKRYIDFFTIGFSATGTFDAKKYNETLNAFEANTNWKPTGGTDLILINVVYDSATKKVTPDFSSALSIKLEDVIKVDGFENLGVFFEKIMSAAKNDCGVESPGGVSNAFGSSLIKSATKGLLSSIVPSGMQKEAKAAFLFAVKNISKQH